MFIQSYVRMFIVYEWGNSVYRNRKEKYNGEEGSLVREDGYLYYFICGEGYKNIYLF